MHRHPVELQASFSSASASSGHGSLGLGDSSNVRTWASDQYSTEGFASPPKASDLSRSSMTSATVQQASPFASKPPLPNSVQRAGTQGAAAARGSSSQAVAGSMASKRSPATSGRTSSGQSAADRTASVSASFSASASGSAVISFSDSGDIASLLASGDEGDAHTVGGVRGGAGGQGGRRSRTPSLSSFASSADDGERAPQLPRGSGAAASGGGAAWPSTAAGRSGLPHLGSSGSQQASSFDSDDFRSASIEYAPDGKGAARAGAMLREGRTASASFLSKSNSTDFGASSGSLKVAEPQEGVQILQLDAPAAGRGARAGNARATGGARASGDVRASNNQSLFGQSDVSFLSSSGSDASLGSPIHKAKGAKRSPVPPSRAGGSSGTYSGSLLTDSADLTVGEGRGDGGFNQSLDSSIDITGDIMAEISGTISSGFSSAGLIDD